MTNIGLFYGSSAGNTEYAARMIQREFHAMHPDLVTLVNVAAYGSVESMQNYDKILVGVSSWADGGLQEDWQRVFTQMDSLQLPGKQAAVFGLGDQIRYPEAFQDAIGIIGRKLRERGAELVGLWPTEGYSFTRSAGVEGDHFLGLSLDYDNELHLSEQRIRQWVKQVAQEFGMQ